MSDSYFDYPGNLFQLVLQDRALPESSYEHRATLQHDAFFRRRGEEHWISKNKLSIAASCFVSLSSSCNPFREISFIWMAGFEHGSNKHPSRRWDSSRSTKGGAQGIFWKKCNASEKNNQRWFKLSQNPNSFVTDRSRLNLFLWILKWNLR